MKIIDLLNKIADGEKVPKKIKYGEYYYGLEKKYNDDWEEYEYGYKTYTGGYLNIWRENALNEEVEIIEEDKKIEKLEQIVTKRGKYNSIDELAIDVSRAFETIDGLIINQNKLIDKVNMLEKEGKK